MANPKGKKKGRTKRGPRLSSQARRAKRPNFTKVNYTAIHKAILAARASLVNEKPTNEADLECLVAAVRNLDVARVLLECNQSLSATDYNPEPWKHLASMGRLLAGKKRRGGPKR